MTGETLYYNSFVHRATKLGSLMLQHSSRPIAPPNGGVSRTAIVVIRPSALRLSLIARVAGAGCLVSGIWMLIAWVLLQ